MSFGKRGPDDRQSTPTEVEHREPAPAARPSGRRGRTIAIAAAIIGCVGANLLFLKWAGRRLDAHFESAFSGQPQEMASATSKAHACKAPSVRRVWYGGRVTVDMELPHTVASAFGQFAQMSEYVSCLLRRDSERLCGKAERAALAADLKTYAALRDDLRAIKEGLMRPPTGGFESVMVGMLRSELGAAATMLEQVEEIDDDVMRLIRRRASDGHIRAADFGWFGSGVPGGIAQVITSTAVDLVCR